MTPGDLAALGFPAGSAGYYAGFIGSIKGGALLYDSVDYALYDMGGGGAFYWGVLGDHTAAMAGCTGFKVNGVTYAIIGTPAFDGSMTTATFAGEPFTSGVEVDVEAVGVVGQVGFSILHAVAMYGSLVGYQASGGYGSMNPPDLAGVPIASLYTTGSTSLIYGQTGDGDYTALLPTSIWIDGVERTLTSVSYPGGATDFTYSAGTSFVNGTAYEVRTTDPSGGGDPGGPTYEGPAFGAVAAGAASTGSVTPAMPSYAIGDRLFLQVETANQAVTAPAGWTIVDGPQGTGTAGGTSATRLTVFTRVPTALGEASPTIADPGDHCVAHIFNVGPCDIHAVVGNAQTSSSTTAAFGALTTAVDNCLILALVTSMTDVATARTKSWTNGFTVRGDYSSTQGNGGGVAVASKEMLTAGAVGATQCTMNTSTMQGKMLIALSPPSGTPPPSREYPRTHSWL